MGDGALTSEDEARVVVEPGFVVGAQPLDAYFGLYLMAMGSGRPRRADEIRALLTEAGFGRIAERRTRRPLLVRVIQARRA